MQLSHAHQKISARFDDPNLLSCAGLVPVAALAQRAGLSRPLERLRGRRRTRCSSWSRSCWARSPARTRSPTWTCCATGRGWGFAEEHLVPALEEGVRRCPVEQKATSSGQEAARCLGERSNNP